jgi:hypothetical protein
MSDSSDHLSLRKRLLKEVYRRTGGDMQCQIDCDALASEMGWLLTDLMLIVEQLIAKTCLQYLHRPLTAGYAGWKIAITMHGIEEAEKMERTWFQRFYEDHVVVWSLVLLILGFVLSTASGYVVNLGRTPEQKPAIIINVPEQKPPVVNIVVPDQKKP